MVSLTRLQVELGDVAELHCLGEEPEEAGLDGDGVLGGGRVPEGQAPLVDSGLEVRGRSTGRGGVMGDGSRVGRGSGGSIGAGEWRRETETVLLDVHSGTPRRRFRVRVVRVEQSGIDVRVPSERRKV